ncbi:efflux RND transporter periplasmic adaptor subunit [Aetokthonos hydrillicola Thurmond2011]|jgi:multidrug efflux pump subunit AcrA (membrane-fusion protein)|uniref:Efflux RND transporter periplasmic adaptor subunit n=1 Tax=Aetokthonos hydrillicola Thurmond2011 TaxID=2712845 RepID=A0AAP5I3R6_9CYAN|nr:efflux RND transporter periplasmic adaptor subunit [Aetokthonos hydrillicola]MBW4585108.1 efflux RND transporter periplasmic adaptor subunit [Aetokthonos hydrillicola CCALA 1050]MDR9894130.1 efflux RND transporter periplasmic adaptor subunit [Aetokthonos hydrillicola Thurmond2011]
MLKVNTLLTTKLLGIAFLTSILLSSCKGSQTSAKAIAAPAIPVKLIKLESTEVKDSSDFVGSLEALERVDLKPEIDGRIVQIHVANGTRVKKGTPIVQLRPDQTQAEYASAIAKVNSAKAARETALAKLKAAEADRVRYESAVTLQKVQFLRAKTLVEQGVQAKQQLDIAQNNQDSAIASLRSAEEQVGSAKASLNQANADLKQATADAAATNVSLQYKQVLSPITGTVGDFPVKIGDYATTNTSLTSIIKNDSLDLRIAIPINRTDQLKVGLPVELIDPNTQKRLTTGKIYFISPQVNSGNQAILAKARFPNPKGNLRDRQFVKARVIWSQNQGILIPTISVTTIGAQNFVFIAQKGSKPVVRQTPITVGGIQGQSYQVLSGIQPGEEIAVTQILNLKDNTPIQPTY